jgi:hypothetical protein
MVVQPFRLGISIGIVAGVAYAGWIFSSSELSRMRERSHYAAEKNAIEIEAEKHGLYSWEFRERTNKTCENTYKDLNIIKSCVNTEFFGGFGERYDHQYSALELPTDFKNLPGQLFGEKLSRLNHL